MSNVYYLSLALKVGMLIDMLHRRAPFWWAFIIVLIPFGEVAYLGFVMLPELVPMRVRTQKTKPLPLAEVRYRCRENPCHENRLLLADCLLDEGLHEESASEWRSLLESDPDDRRGLFGLARCLLALDARTEAITHLERLVRLRRSFEDYAAWRTLAEALSKDGRHDDALRTAGQLVQAAPRMRHQVTLAQVQQNAGLADEARRTLEQALEDYKHSPRFIRREAKGPAREANRLLGQLEAA